jgi:ATP adenylyltransferase
MLQSRRMTEHLWAPWRMSYVNESPTDGACIFCQALGQPDGPGNLIVYRGPRTFAILNRYPYTSGHLMAVPQTHVPSLEALDDETLLELMHLSNHSLAVLRQVYGAANFNLGVNLGRSAGAGVEEHVHIHIVPRWDGDTNFMSALADTRVLPEALEATFARLHQAWT